MRNEDDLEDWLDDMAGGAICCGDIPMLKRIFAISDARGHGYTGWQCPKCGRIKADPSLRPTNTTTDECRCSCSSPLHTCRICAKQKAFKRSTASRSTAR